MPPRDPEAARRLDRVLRDLRYGPEDGGEVDIRRACRVINRHQRRELDPRRLAQLHRGSGAAMTAREAVQIAEGLGVDVRRLLYDPENMPRFPERPENLIDFLDLIGHVEP